MIFELLQKLAGVELLLRIELRVILGHVAQLTRDYSPAVL